MIYGSLCIYSPVDGQAMKPLPQFANPHLSIRHTPHPQRGLVELMTMIERGSSTEIHLPQRSKSFQIFTMSNDFEWSSKVNAYFEDNLPRMESQHEMSRQLYKLNEYQKELRKLPKSQAWTTLLLNNGDHAHLGILTQWQDLHLIGVYDTVNSSVRLVWTDDEYFVTDVREQDYARYVFYRFPMLVDRPLFLYTQALCSKWYTWMKTFGHKPDAVIKAFNALEQFLYKPAELPSMQISKS